MFGDIGKIIKGAIDPLVEAIDRNTRANENLYVALCTIAEKAVGIDLSEIDMSGVDPEIPKEVSQARKKAVEVGGVLLNALSKVAAQALDDYAKSMHGSEKGSAGA